MRSVLSVVLFLSVLGVISSANDTATQGEKLESEKLLSASVGLADVIYNNHKKCEIHIYKAVTHVLYDEEPGFQYPLPTQEYVECKHVLDKLKREYIKVTHTNLGNSVDDVVFPLRLSSGRTVYLPLPADENNDDFEFDANDELCVVSSICNEINRKKYSDNPENKKDRKLYTTPSSRCLDLVKDLKLKYIYKKNVSDFKLKKDGGITVMCSGGRQVFYIKPYWSDNEHSTPSGSLIKPQTNKPTEAIPEPIKLPHSLVGVKQNKEATTKNVSPDGNKSESKTSTVEHDASKPIKGSQIKTLKFSKENEKQHQLENDNGFTNPSEQTTNRATTEDHNSLVAVSTVNNNDKSEEKQEEKNNRGNPTKGGQSNLRKSLRYRVTVVDKSGNGMVFRLIATQRSTLYSYDNEDDSKTSTPESLNADSGHSIPDVKSDNSLHAVYHHVKKTEADHKDKPEKFTVTLGDTIANMEDDCKQLLEYATSMHKEGKLESFLSFEEHYQECLMVLAKLKKLYIEKHGITEYQHNSVFPVKLSSGKEKLVTFPPKLESQRKENDLHQSALLPTLDDFSGKSDQFETTTFKKNEPMDNPAFIPNDKFIEGLTQGSTSTETSTLSKLSNMLLRNGGYNQMVAE